MYLLIFVWMNNWLSSLTLHPQKFQRREDGLCENKHSGAPLLLLAQMVNKGSFHLISYCILAKVAERNMPAQPDAIT